MKRYFILTLLILQTSCDPPYYMELYIYNNCEQEIMINMSTGEEAGKPKTSSITIEPHTTKFILECSQISGIGNEDIHYFIQKLTIKKDGKNMIHDPLDISRWKFAHLSKYSNRSVLIVNPEDFERRE